MILNYNCMRDMLLMIRNNTGFDDNGERITLTFDKLCFLLDNYTKSDVIFVFMRINDESFIKATISKADNLDIYAAIIYQLTKQGDDFLDSILDNKKWNKFLKKATKLGVSSIPTIIEIIKSLQQS